MVFAWQDEGDGELHHPAQTVRGEEVLEQAHVGGGLLPLLLHLPHTFPTPHYNQFFALYQINLTVGKSKTHPLTDFMPYPIAVKPIYTVIML